SRWAWSPRGPQPRYSRSPWRVGGRCRPPSSDAPTARLEAKRGHDSHHARCTRSRSPVTTSPNGDDPEKSPTSSPASPRTPSPHEGADLTFRTRAAFVAVWTTHQRMVRDVSKGALPSDSREK